MTRMTQEELTKAEKADNTNKTRITETHTSACHFFSVLEFIFCQGCCQPETELVYTRPRKDFYNDLFPGSLEGLVVSKIIVLLSVLFVRLFDLFPDSLSPERVFFSLVPPYFLPPTFATLSLSSSCRRSCRQEGRDPAHARKKALGCLANPGRATLTKKISFYHFTCFQWDYNCIFFLQQMT